MDQRLSCNPISVLVPAIPDTSGRYTGHVRNTQNRSTDFLSLAIPDTSDRFRTEPINLWLVIYQILMDCEHLLNSNLNMANHLVVVQNSKLTPKFLIE